MCSIHATHRDLGDLKAVLVMIIVERILSVTNIDIVAVGIPGPRPASHYRATSPFQVLRSSRYFLVERILLKKQATQ